MTAPPPDRWPFPAWTTTKDGRYVPVLRRVPVAPAPQYPTDEGNLL